MRLPNQVCQNLGIDPEAEYDALFRMPPRRLAWIFYGLSICNTKTVSISIVENQGVTSVSFTKVMGNGNVILDRGSDSSSNDDDDPPYSVNCSHNADHVQPEEAIIIEMEAAVVKLVCMMCLHDYINSITKAFPGASQVTMYMGRDLPTVIEFRASELNFMYRPPPANHRYHRKRERAKVRNEGHMDPSEDEMDAEDVQGDENPEDGDEDVDAEDEQGDENPEDGDEDEVDPHDGYIEEDEIVVHNRKRVWSDITDDEDSEDDSGDVSGDGMQENEVDEEQQNQGVVEQDNQVDVEQENQGDAEQENQGDAGQENQVDAEPENEVRGRD